MYSNLIFSLFFLSGIVIGFQLTVFKDQVAKHKTVSVWHFKWRTFFGVLTFTSAVIIFAIIETFMKKLDKKESEPVNLYSKNNVISTKQMDFYKWKYFKVKCMVFSVIAIKVNDKSNDNSDGQIYSIEVKEKILGVLKEFPISTKNEAVEFNHKLRRSQTIIPTLNKSTMEVCVTGYPQYAFSYKALTVILPTRVGSISLILGFIVNSIDTYFSLGIL